MAACRGEEFPEEVLAQEAGALGSKLDCVLNIEY